MELIDRIKRTYDCCVALVSWIDTHNGLVTALATVFVALFTISLSIDSRRQAEASRGNLNAIRSQLDLMKQDQRAWVGFASDPKLTGLQIVTKDWALAQFSIALRNVGKSPARRVGINAALIPLQVAGSKSGEMQQDLCEKATRPRSLKPGESWIEQNLFPDQTVYMENVPVSTMQEGDLAAGKNGEISVYFTIIGCITYQIIGSERLHQTGFIFDLVRIDNKPLSVLPGTQINAQEMAMRAGDKGTGKAD